MNDTKQNSRRALTIITALTLIVAGFEILMAYSNYKPGMNLLDITSYVILGNDELPLIGDNGEVCNIPLLELFIVHIGIGNGNKISHTPRHDIS